MVNTAKRIVLLASGSGSLAQAVMQAVANGTLNVEIAAVISDRPAPVLNLARENGFTTSLVEYSSFDTRDAWGRALENEIAHLNPDLVVSLGFMRILPARFVERFQTINTHPALLPLFPGTHAVRDALAAGAKETGTTVHWVDAGVDTGKVISQVSLAIQPGDTEESLHERIKIEERRLIVETLIRYVDSGEIQ
jgi:phosphoribosylglycinamide formyltransferase-1